MSARGRTCVGCRLKEPKAALRPIHDALIHVEVLDGKLWIQFDGTEDGIASELVEAGIPRDHIVLGFKPPEVRPDTDFAAA